MRMVPVSIENLLHLLHLLYNPHMCEQWTLWRCGSIFQSCLQLLAGYKKSTSIVLQLSRFCFLADGEALPYDPSLYVPVSSHLHSYCLPPLPLGINKHSMDDSVCQLWRVESPEVCDESHCFKGILLSSLP